MLSGLLAKYEYTWLFDKFDINVTRFLHHQFVGNSALGMEKGLRAARGGKEVANQLSALGFLRRILSAEGSIDKPPTARTLLESATNGRFWTFTWQAYVGYVMNLVLRRFSLATYYSLFI